MTMTPRAASWSFHEEDSARIRGVLQDFLRDASARTALLVDRAGQMLVTVGEPPQFDPTAFASLTAADFSANDQLARLLGEPEFGVRRLAGREEGRTVRGVTERRVQLR